MIDKENGGGKADASNAGINAARYPIFYCGDADSILDPAQRSSTSCGRSSRTRRTVACGGTVRIINGCKVRGGVLEEVGLPKNPLALVQVVEYLRAFLSGRMGWSAINGMLIVSGAFGVFHRDTVVEAGGYRHDVIGEDMELIVRLHRMLVKRGQRYRVAFIPDPVCWTDAPEDVETLKKQRKRWQRGLAESLWDNRELCFMRGSRAAGLAGVPVLPRVRAAEPARGSRRASSSWLSPLPSGMMTGANFLAFLLAAFALGLMLSTTSLLLEELSFHTYPKARHLARAVPRLNFRELRLSPGHVRLAAARAVPMAVRRPDRLGRHEAQSHLAAVRGSKGTLPFKGERPL